MNEYMNTRWGKTKKKNEMFLTDQFQLTISTNALRLF